MGDGLHREIAPAGVAVQHRAEWPLRHLLVENASAVFIGVAGVDHQRQPGGARRRDVGAEASLLRRARAVLVEVVETRLAQRHHLGMACQRDQFLRRDAVLLVGLMRMSADRAINLGIARGDRQQRIEAANTGGDGDDAPYPGRPRTRDDAVEVVGELGKIEMAMAVDKHRGLQVPAGST